MKISIITPSYNQGEYIEQAIVSAIDQKHVEVELLVLDGGSTDKTVEILTKYDKYIKFWRSVPDKGQAAAIAEGHSKATGEVINWLNSDDYLQPNALSEIAASFEDPSTLVYCGRSRIFGMEPDRKSNGTFVCFQDLDKTIGMARIDQPETFFRKSCWDILGGVNPSFHYLMDKELWVRHLLYFGLKGIAEEDRVVVNFRHHSQSKTVTKQDYFYEESHLLYGSLAKLFNLDIEWALKSRRQADAMRAQHNYGDPARIFNYYFYQNLQRSYAAADLQGFDEVLSNIRMELLSPSERIALKNLFIRRNIIPKWSRDSLRKIGSLFTTH